MFKKIDQRYLDSLHQKEESIEEAMRKREAERVRANETFIQGIRKELEMLITEKQKMNSRNEEFLKGTQ